MLHLMYIIIIYCYVIICAFDLQIMSAVAAHVNSISVGMCQGFSAVLLPQLLNSNSSISVNNVEASWIGEAKTTSIIAASIALTQIDITDYTVPTRTYYLLVRLFYGPKPFEYNMI